MAPVQERIQRLLSTPIGSRVMRPTYGSRLFELMDRSFNQEWQLDFTAYVTQALKIWEPGLKLQKVDVSMDAQGVIHYSLYFKNSEAVHGQL